MEAVLEILPLDFDAGKCTLVCEISNEGFSYAIKDDETNAYIGVAFFHFVKTKSGEDYPAVLQKELDQHVLLSAKFKKVYIMYSSAESVLLPFSLHDFQENANVLDFIHGDLQTNVSVLTDIIVKNGIYNCYRVPSLVLNVIKSKFPEGVNRHQYSILLRQVSPEEDKLLIIFYPKTVVVMLNNNGSNQFINSFSYSTAQDVVYIMLNTCRQFGAEDIPVEIWGMIEKNSALFNEIYKYFSTVSFAELPSGCNYAAEISKHPSHYFSHIFAFDSCE